MTLGIYIMHSFSYKNSCHLFKTRKNNCKIYYRFEIKKNTWCFPFFKLNVSFICSSLQKCLKFNVDAPIWLSKQRILCTLNQSLKDVLNYGLFQPAYNGRAGKFLDEERQLREYPFPSFAPVPYLEVGVNQVFVWILLCSISLLFMYSPYQDGLFWKILFL